MRDRYLIIQGTLREDVYHIKDPVSIHGSEIRWYTALLKVLIYSRSLFMAEFERRTPRSWTSSDGGTVHLVSFPGHRHHELGGVIL